jgi:hypothetical protein
MFSRNQKLGRSLLAKSPPPSDCGDAAETGNLRLSALTVDLVVWGGREARSAAAPSSPGLPSKGLGTGRTLTSSVESPTSPRGGEVKNIAPSCSPGRPEPLIALASTRRASGAGGGVWREVSDFRAWGVKRGRDWYYLIASPFHSRVPVSLLGSTSRVSEKPNPSFFVVSSFRDFSRMSLITSPRGFCLSGGTVFE